MLLVLPNGSDRDCLVAVCSFNVFWCGSGWPEDEIILIERRKKLIECFCFVVYLVERELLRKPLLLFNSAC